jgi:hypothetical protein
MLKKICFSADLKKTALQNGSRRAEPDQKNLARRQDGPEFSNPEVWTEHDEYMILMDEPDYEIDVLPAYPGSLTSLTENIKNHKKKYTTRFHRNMVCLETHVGQFLLLRLHMDNFRNILSCPNVLFLYSLESSQSVL